MDRIKRARSQLVMRHPFFGCLALNLDLIADNSEGNPTAWTDGDKLAVNEAFAASLTDAQLRGLLAHEVYHCACQHMTRRGKREHETWNIAADYTINVDLIDMGFELPDGALYDKSYKDKSAEAIYATLMQERDENGDTDKLGNDPGQCGAVRDAPDGATGDDWTAKTFQAASVAKATGALPGAIARLVEGIRSPRPSWKETLRRFVDNSISKETSWQRPNRRFIGDGLYLPGKVSNSVGHIVCVVDVSGSMDTNAVKACLTELQGILDDACADKLTVGYCDAAMCGHDVYEQGDTIKIGLQAAGGGTNFAPGIAWADTQESAACLIYLTDLDCNSFGQEPSMPVLWASWAGERRVPYGEVVKIDPHA